MLKCVFVTTTLNGFLHLEVPLKAMAFDTTKTVLNNENINQISIIYQTFKRTSKAT